jgi:hypothetical protein
VRSAAGGLAVERCGECGRSAKFSSFGEINYSEAAKDWLCLNCADKAAAKQAGLRITTTNVAPPPSLPKPLLNPEPNPNPNPVCIAEGDEVPEDDGRPDIEVYLEQYSAGEIQPIEVHLPPLPKDATNTMERIVEFYRLDRGLRLETCDDDAVPFGSAWVARKLGRPRVTRTTVSRALSKLVEAGVLVRGDDMRTTSGNLVYTYLPGPGKRLRSIDGATRLKAGGRHEHDPPQADPSCRAVRRRMRVGGGVQPDRRRTGDARPTTRSP